MDIRSCPWVQNIQFHLEMRGRLGGSSGEGTKGEGLPEEEAGLFHPGDPRRGGSHSLDVFEGHTGTGGDNLVL